MAKPIKIWDGSAWQEVVGLPGIDGVGVPSGGSTGQVLAKNSATDYDTEWIDVTASPAIDDLSDVAITSASSGDVIVYNGSSWVNQSQIKQLAVFNQQSSTSYTLSATDQGKTIEISNASAITLTVPLNSSVAFPVGTVIDIIQTGAGQITVSATGGVTVNATPGLKLRAQWSSATLIKRATDTWILMGDLVA